MLYLFWLLWLSQYSKDFTASCLTLTIFTRWFCPLVFFSLQRKKSYGNGAKMQTPSFPLCLIGFKSLQAWYSSWWFRFLYLSHLQCAQCTLCTNREKCALLFFLKKTSSTNFCNAGKNVTKLDDASKGNKSAANLQANWWFFGAAQQWRQVQI